MSYLDQSIEELQRDVVAGLEGEGFPYNELTTEWQVYLATCLGDANAWKTKSVNRMLAELNTTFGGSTVSHKTSSPAQLLSALNTTLGGGGGGGEYHADAVHFDGSTWLGNASLVASDVATFSFSVWIKVATANQGQFGTITIGDPDNNYTANVYDNNADIKITLANGGDNMNTSITGAMSSDAWHHVLISADTNHTAGNKIAKIYLDDVDRTDAFSDVMGAFDIPLNGLPFYVGSDTFDTNFIGDMAELWVSTTSLLTAGDIPEATRRMFISAGGKPVDPANFPSGFCLLSGDASGFPTNQGTGGAFSVTSGSLTNASTSPSD